jgi:SIR2-like domain
VWESFAVTEDDFIHYGDVAGRLPVALAARLRRTHLLLLGYTLSDWTLRVVLERLWGEEPLRYRSWSVHAGPPPLEREFWRRRNVEVVDMAPDAYASELEHVVGGSS